MPTVYITQVPHKRDPDTRALVPSINVLPATDHGTLTILYPPQTAFTDTTVLIRQLATALTGYNAEQGDCLLPLGDPVVSSCAIALLAQRGPFRLLRYDKLHKAYVAIWIGVPSRQRRA